jgi:hypothetical protein
MVALLLGALRLQWAYQKYALPNDLAAKVQDENVQDESAPNPRRKFFLASRHHSVRQVAGICHAIPIAFGLVVTARCIRN